MALMKAVNELANCLGRNGFTGVDGFFGQVWPRLEWASIQNAALHGGSEHGGYGGLMGIDG